MPNYRRAYIPGGVVFLTLVTLNRRPIHGLMRCPQQWEFSSFRRFVGEELYEKDWGCGDVDFVGEGLDVGE